MKNFLIEGPRKTSRFRVSVRLVPIRFRRTAVPLPLEFCSSSDMFLLKSAARLITQVIYIVAYRDLTIVFMLAEGILNHLGTLSRWLHSQKGAIFNAPDRTLLFYSKAVRFVRVNFAPMRIQPKKWPKLPNVYHGNVKTSKVKNLPINIRAGCCVMDLFKF